MEAHERGCLLDYAVVGIFPAVQESVPVVLVTL